jgi:hypothetical protein
MFFSCFGLIDIQVPRYDEVGQGYDQQGETVVDESNWLVYSFSFSSELVVLMMLMKVLLLIAMMT